MIVVFMYSPGVFYGLVIILLFMGIMDLIGNALPEGEPLVVYDAAYWKKKHEEYSARKKLENTTIQHSPDHEPLFRKRQFID